MVEQQHLSADEVGQVEGKPASLWLQCMAQVPPAPLELPLHASLFKEEKSSIFKIQTWV